nr:hypothetical protein [Serratia fonticola]
MLVITIITSTVCFAGVSARNTDFRSAVRQAYGTSVLPSTEKSQKIVFIHMNLLDFMRYRIAHPCRPGHVTLPDELSVLNIYRKYLFLHFVCLKNALHCIKFSRYCIFGLLMRQCLTAVKTQSNIDHFAHYKYDNDYH